MTNRELILQELEQTPDPILGEVLDFLRYLKQKSRQTKTIRVISGDRESIVSLEDASRSEALGEMFSSQYFLSPVSQIQRELNEALTASGYNSKDQVVELVQEVKREMWHEQHVND
ncbi:DUF2281 domain-containing protein [Leptolyngbya sp. KIOST-1]|uniref:DUF2281 domain-containing protein n=1 Tax=Leptolyngbya sp. KIOST-1 TaxID=1229172 RepID=UPI0012E0B88C|nr:DUF2281 domain-containing protein [Leptolyngbya sp. KIOST-1]